jgi:hypothetical protein
MDHQKPGRPEEKRVTGHKLQPDKKSFDFSEQHNLILILFGSNYWVAFIAKAGDLIIINRLAIIDVNCRNTNIYIRLYMAKPFQPEVVRDTSF